MDLSAFGTLLLKFNNVDINYVTEFADFNLEKATVKFYPDLGIIEGTNGIIYSDNNLSYLTNINFNLSSFSIDLGKGMILSKEAYLNAKEQKNVKGIFEFLDWAKSKKISMGVCTNKREVLAIDLLKKINMYKYFDYVAGADTFEINKPDPRHLTNVIEIIGGDLSKTIMVGDSEVDSNSAYNANLPFVLVKNGYTENLKKR